MNTMKMFVLSVMTVACLLPVSAAEWYVSQSTGKNGNAGNTAAAPLKNIQKAIEKAAAGDTIKVAAGNYYGIMNRGNIKLDKGVTIEGGYSVDFTARDILKYRTLLQPSNKANGTTESATLFLSLKDTNSVTVLDGLLFDKGESNNYHTREGIVEGVGGGGMLMEPPGKSKEFTNAKWPLLGGENAGHLTIRNCAFVNGNMYGIQLGSRAGSVKVLNCIFIANAFAGVEIRGLGGPSVAYPELEFAHNTVLFSWSRTKAMDDMGYGVRFMTGMHYNLHDNIIGFSCFSGTDATRDDNKRQIKMDNNIFMLNKQADLTLPGGGMFLRVWVDDFEDLEFASNSGNVSLKDPAAFKNVLHIPYTNGFLSASYKEHAEYDENSPANAFRTAMGMNKQGKLTTKVSMFANKYPFDDALKLFGAMSGKGAQLP